MRKLFLLLTLLPLLLTAAAVGTNPSPAHAQPGQIQAPLPYWFKCVLTYPGGQRLTCRQYAVMHAPRAPLAYRRHCQVWNTRRRQTCVRYPQFQVIAKATTPSVAPSAASHAPSAASYTRSMLVTYYLWTGSPMTNGVFPSIGWAACGYELALGTRVYVPGIGTLTCGDRIGFSPWNHIDVYGVPLGTSYRNVTVFP